MFEVTVMDLSPDWEEGGKQKRRTRVMTLDAPSRWILTLSPS